MWQACHIYCSIGVFTPPASWSVLSSLTAYGISFTILGMSFLVSHWRQQRFQCGRRVAGWVIAALSHGCSRGMIEVSLERSQIVHWKQLWWLPSTRKNLLDAAKVLTSFPTLAGPCSQLVKASLKPFTGFHRKQLHLVTAPVQDELNGRS